MLIIKNCGVIRCLYNGSMAPGMVQVDLQTMNIAQDLKTEMKCIEHARV